MKKGYLRNVVNEAYVGEVTPDESGPYVEIARGQLILDVEGQRVKVVFHPAGDIDIFDSKDNVVDSDNPHFQAIDDFIQKVVS